jgi:hypothetical protein
MLDLGSDEFLVFRRPEAGDADLVLPERIPIEGNSIAATLGPDELAELTETAALAREGLPAFDVEAFRAGSMTPVLFGSALRRFGVSELLDVLETFSHGPRAQARARERPGQAVEAEEAAADAAAHGVDEVARVRAVRRPGVHARRNLAGGARPEEVHAQAAVRAARRRVHRPQVGLPASRCRALRLRLHRRCVSTLHGGGGKGSVAARPAARPAAGPTSATICSFAKRKG